MARQLGGASVVGDELLDVVVIGGSQAGLAMAWHLARQHLRFVVLEAGPEPGHTWRSRWDSLTLFTPAQYAALPDMPFPGSPDTYPTKEQVAGYLNAYAAEFNLPVRLNARVTALILTAEGFEARTDDGVFRARQVVVATGPFQAPHVPPTAQRLDGSVSQLHSAGYRNPRTLPPGPVLVVGGGNSGFQIAGGARRDPPGRPCDRYQGAGAAAAAGGQGPVLVAHPARPDARHRRVPAGTPPAGAARLHHRQQPPSAPGGRGPVPARGGRRGRAYRPVRRRQQPGRRHRDLDHRLPPGLLLDTHPRRSR